MPYVTIEEAAKRLGKNDRTIRRWIHQGKLAHKQKGRRLLVEVEVEEPAPTRSDTDEIAELHSRLESLEARVSILEEQAAPAPGRKNTRTRKQGEQSERIAKIARGMKQERSGWPAID